MAQAKLSSLGKPSPDGAGKQIFVEKKKKGGKNPFRNISYLLILGNTALQIIYECVHWILLNF